MGGHGHTITVLLVDDHALVRKGIASYLVREEGVEVVGEASTLDEARTEVERLKPDVVLLDIQLRDERGTDLVPHIRKASPHTAVIVLSSFLNPALVHVCMSQGVAGYLVKDTEELDIAAAVRTVAAGGTVFDPRVFGMQRELSGQLERLSPREFQVLEHVCHGYMNAEIALKLGVTESAIKGYVSSLMRKLDCDNRVKLVLKARELNLV